MYSQLDLVSSQQRGGFPNLLGFHCHVTLHVCVDGIGVSGERVVVVELVGPASKSAEPLQLHYVAGLNAILGPGNLGLAGRFGLQSLNFLNDGSFDLIYRMAWIRGGLDRKFACNLLAVVIDADLAGYPPFID